MRSDAARARPREETDDGHRAGRIRIGRRAPRLFGLPHVRTASGPVGRSFRREATHTIESLHPSPISRSRAGGVTMHPRRFGKTFPLLLTIALFSSVVVLLSPGSASAQIVIRVPLDKPTIQGAIDAAAAGDSVLVAPGTYVENINFHGKAITVESEQGAQATIIDGNLAGPVVTFTSGDGRASILRGFTLQGGDASGQVLKGGGVRIDGSSPTIQANVITNNRACDSGGGIDADFSSALIEGNFVTNNTQFGCSGGGGGGGG